MVQLKLPFQVSPGHSLCQAWCHLMGVTVKLRSVAACARLRTTYQEVQGMLRPATACLRDFRKFKVQVKAGHLCGKATGSGSGQARELGGVGSRIHQGWANCVSQVRGGLRLAPVHTGQLYGGQHLTGLLSPEKSTLPPAPLAPALSQSIWFLPICAWCSLSCFFHTGAQSK